MPLIHSPSLRCDIAIGGRRGQVLAFIYKSPDPSSPISDCDIASRHSAYRKSYMPISHVFNTYADAISLSHPKQYLITKHSYRKPYRIPFSYMSLLPRNSSFFTLIQVLTKNLGLLQIMFMSLFHYCIVHIYKDPDPCPLPIAI